MSKPAPQQSLLPCATVSDAPLTIPHASWIFSTLRYPPRPGKAPAPAPAADAAPADLTLKIDERFSSNAGKPLGGASRLKLTPQVLAEVPD